MRAAILLVTISMLVSGCATTVGAAGGAAGGAAVGYSSAGVLCTIGGPLCAIVVIPAAIVGGLLGGAAGGVVDAVSAGPKPPAEAPLPADSAAPQGG